MLFKWCHSRRMAATVFLSKAGPSFDGYFTGVVHTYACPEAGFMINIVAWQTCRTSKNLTMIIGMTDSRDASSAYALHALDEMQSIRGDVSSIAVWE